MKLALDHQITQGYGGTVVGILVQGWKVLAFNMVLEHEAVYELRNIGKFHLVADHTQIGQLTICPVLIEAKVRMMLWMLRKFIIEFHSFRVLMMLSL
jgi:hypothetical protein